MKKELLEHFDKNGCFYIMIIALSIIIPIVIHIYTKQNEQKEHEEEMLREQQRQQEREKKLNRIKNDDMIYIDFYNVIHLDSECKYINHYNYETREGAYSIKYVPKILISDDYFRFETENQFCKQCSPYEIVIDINNIK